MLRTTKLLNFIFISLNINDLKSVTIVTPLLQFKDFNTIVS